MLSELQPIPELIEDSGLIKNLEKHMQGVRIVPTAAALFALGAVLGPPLDSLHSGVNLLIYDKFPVTIGAPLHVPSNIFQLLPVLRLEFAGDRSLSTGRLNFDRVVEDVAGGCAAAGRLLRRRRPSAAGAG